MKIKLNGIEKQINQTANLKELILAELGNKTDDGIAVALNLKVIHKRDWESTFLKEGDEVEIVTAMQGG